MSIVASTVHPFIIWTLQRTGGTNLTQRLTERSGLPGTEHEPFNPGRIFGHVTEQWIRDKNPDRLRRAMEEISQRGVIIKHCVETVPWEITEALARASASAGYRHLFLYRKNALDRLLSLHFAKKTGVWGPNMQKFASLTGAWEADSHATPEAVGKAAFAEAVPVQKMVKHEKSCVQILTRTWDALNALGATPWAIAYEDIYRTADPEQPVHILLPVLRYLGMSGSDAEDRAWVGDVVGKGDQGTRNKYRDFPGVGELAKRIQAVAPFAPYGDAISIESRVIAGNHSWIERCFIDVLPTKVYPGVPFELGGVIVINQAAPADLTLEAGRPGRTIPAQWGLPSQRMAKEHPQGLNSANARFLVKELSFQADEEGFALTLSGPNGERVVVAEVLRSEIPDYTRIYVEPKDRLIFDVGGNDGADTWYYLRKGFRVVVVEAIPELAENLRHVFQAQIAAKRLVVEAVAIADEEGEVTFTINEEWTEWSSAHGAPKASAGNNRTVTVPATTLASLVARHGPAHYIKIDIEGGELAAIKALSAIPAGDQPQLLSFEINPRFGEILERLYELGFRRFQLVRQGAGFLPYPPRPSREGLDYPCTFTSNMSGPFGEDLPETKWVGLVEIIQSILKAQADMQASKARGENPGWYYVHAARLIGARE